MEEAKGLCVGPGCAKPWKYKALKLCTGHRRQIDRGRPLTPIKSLTDRSMDTETHRACSRCLKLLPLESFGPKINGPSASCRSCDAIRAKANRYGITDDQVRTVEATTACTICGSPEPGERGWVVDHDHVTNEVRGALCRFCNVGLGMFKDDVIALEAAIAYLKNPPGIKG